ncbi:MAG: spore germination protein [Clostridiales bacterium]|nr:spore germination protein [Clostridiales bacterium]
MIGYLKKLMRLGKRARHLPDDVRAYEASDETPLSSSLKRNLASLKGIFEGSGDVVFREFSFGSGDGRNAALLFIDGLVNQAQINESIVKPLMLWSRAVPDGGAPDFSDMDAIMRGALTASEVKKIAALKEAVEGCLSGDAVLFAEGFSEALVVNAKGWEKRAVSEPDNEAVVRGPREGFTENLRTNTALLRRKIKNPALRLESTKIGDRTNTSACIVYVEGLANPDLLKEIRKRLSSIKTDAILSSGYVEEYIEDNQFSVFQTIGYSEKPDVVAGKLLEGRAALIVDGSPFVLTMPMLFIENFQTSEDYVVRAYYATFLRLLRLFAFVFSLLGPALYVVLTTYHQELIPTPLLFTMASSSEGVPFPAAVEVAIMLLSFEVLKEAGVRLPQPVGQAISIVGALVMGQAAVQAGFVGAPVVIIIAFTAVASFVSPYVVEAVSVLRWYLLILASTMGGFGVTLGVLTILVHMAALKSFSTPYLSPLAPLNTPDLKDTFVRAPMWLMKTRPRALKPQDMKRQDMHRPEFSNDGSEDSLP